MLKDALMQTPDLTLVCDISPLFSFGSEFQHLQECRELGETSKMAVSFFTAY